MKKDLQYRADIDGLRGVAVVMAVLFHAFPKTFDHGFIGADIFFVISGFLITGIILSSLDKDKFTFADFYARRIRRIFPALILILFVVLVFGYFNFFPHEFRQLTKHVVGGAGFFSNFLFWQEVGYFDTAAYTKPLLHLWSLSVEEQFYIIFPVLLFFLYKRKVNLLVAFGIIWVASFGFNLHEYKTNPSATFYLPLTRFWEMLTGSILAVLAKNNRIVFNKKIIPLSKNFLKNLSKNNFTAHIVSLLGFILIAWGLVTSKYGLVDNSAHPGVGALLPVFGTAMIIVSNGKGIINKILGHRSLVSMGLISYPLYLWHWPILSYLSIATHGFDFRTTGLYLYTKTLLPSLSHYELSDIIAVTVKILAIGFAILLSIMTYHYGEKKIRSGRDKKIQKMKTISLSAIMAMICITSFALYKFTPKISEKSGNLYQLQSYFNATYFYFDSSGIVRKTVPYQACLDYVKIKFYTSENANNGVPYYHCQFNDVASDKTIALTGTSYARASYPGMFNYLAKKNVNTLLISNERYIRNTTTICYGSQYGNYPPDLTNDQKQQCIVAEKKIIEIFVKRNIKDVFITTDPISNNSYQPMIDMFRQHDINVYIITPFPRLVIRPRNCITKQPPYGKSPLVDCVALPASLSGIEKIKNLKNATIIDVAPAFCPNGICKVFNENGDLLYIDRLHFSKAGSQFLTNNVLAPYLDKIAKEN